MQSGVWTCLSGVSCRLRYYFVESPIGYPLRIVKCVEDVRGEIVVEIRVQKVGWAPVGRAGRHIWMRAGALGEELCFALYVERWPTIMQTMKEAGRSPERKPN